MIVSHDRALPDGVTTRSLFLRDTALRTFALPYSCARASVIKADAAQVRQSEIDLAKADQLRRQAAKLKNIGINNGSDLLVVKIRQLNALAKKIEAQVKATFRDTSAGEIPLANSCTHAKAFVSLNDKAISAPGGPLLFKTGVKWIERSDRVVVLGLHGAGKTRCVPPLLEAILQGNDAIRVTPSLMLGHSDQGLVQLPPDATLFDLVTAFKTVDGPACSLLAEAGIRADLPSRPLAPPCWAGKRRGWRCFCCGWQGNREREIVGFHA